MIITEPTAYEIVNVDGIESIPEYWKKPINDTLHTSIFGVGTVKISDRVKMTMEHIQ